MHIDPPKHAPSAPLTLPLTPPIQKLISELQLSLGQTYQALLTQLTPVTEEERQQLLQLYADKRAIQTPANNTLIKMLKDPALQLAELQIRDQPLATVTTLPLKVAQNLWVTLTAQGLKWSLEPPPTNAPLTPKSLPQSLPTLSGDAALLATKTAQTALVPASVLNTASWVAPKPTQTGRVLSTPLLAQTLSTALPLSLPVVNLLNRLKTIPLEAKQQPPLAPTPSSKLISPNTVQLPTTTLSNTLTALKNAAFDVASANLPQSVKQAFLNSGIFYEARLKQNTLTPSANTAVQSPLNTQLQVQSKTAVKIEPGLTKDLIVSLDTKIPHPLLNPKNAQQNTAQQDIKGLLLQVQHQLVDFLKPLSAPAVPTKSSPDGLTQLMASLSHLFSTESAPTNRSPADKFAQDIQALKQLVERSLANIHTQQCRTLSPLASDSTAPLQWHMDIPIKTPEGFYNAYLFFKEEPIPPDPDDKKAAQRRSTQRRARWRVFLELELDDLGTLASEILAQDNQVAITLWANNSQLREQASHHLGQLKNDLEKQGITLDDLRCSLQPPPSQKMQLDYSLIDTQT